MYVLTGKLNIFSAIITAIKFMSIIIHKFGTPITFSDGFLFLDCLIRFHTFACLRLLYNLDINFVFWFEFEWIAERQHCLSF